MLLLKHSAILRVMLIFLHITSLLAESFSINLEKENSIDLRSSIRSNKKLSKFIIKKRSLESLDLLNSFLIKNNPSEPLKENIFLNFKNRDKREDETNHLLLNYTDSNIQDDNKIIKKKKNLDDSSNSKQSLIDESKNNFNESLVDVPSLSSSSYYKYIIFLARILYAIVCVVGLCGNTLVIYVVLRFSKMQTVTNMYILNLALADEMFLFGLPFLISTISLNYWAFGWFMCKVYMIMTSINQFTSSLLLTVMSADRYIAVCHPISSPRYRTPCIAKIICLSVWALSAYLMVPIALYADSQTNANKTSCNIYWPKFIDVILGQRAFIIYSFTLGFFVPLVLILLFYFLVIAKLRKISTKHKSKEKKKTQKKVTYLVLVVISCYICCWLPYWITQVYITFEPPTATHNAFSFTIMLLAGCLSYANSAVNPILYAFLSENFKKSFKKAFTCTSNFEVNAQLHGENSVFPPHHNTSKNKPSSNSRVETASTYLDSSQKKIKKKTKQTSDKAKKDIKKQNQITNSTNKITIINSKKNKRLSLDLSIQQSNHRPMEIENVLTTEHNLTKCNNEDYQNYPYQTTESANKLKLIKLNATNKEQPLSFVLDEHKLNEPDQIDNQGPMSSARFKRRRKSEPKLSCTNNLEGQIKENRSTNVSQDDIELGQIEKLNKEPSSELDEDDLAFDSEEEDEDFEEDNSSLNSQTKEHNCVAMPARFRAKFLSVSGSKFRLSRNSTSLKRTNSSNSIEVTKASSSTSTSAKNNNNRKISVISSESSQTKKDKNKLINLMNKLTNKQSDRQIIKTSNLIIEKRPENRISRKRITKAEAEHHRFGKKQQIQMAKINSQQLDNSSSCENKQSDEIKSFDLDECEIIEVSELPKNLQSNSVSESKVEITNDNNNNNHVNEEQLIKNHEINCINCTNSKFCASNECAQCSKCLQKRGVIQTQL